MEKLIIDYNALSLSRSCDSKVDVFTALTFNITLLEYLKRNKISVNSKGYSSNTYKIAAFLNIGSDRQ